MYRTLSFVALLATVFVIGCGGEATDESVATGDTGTEKTPSVAVTGEATEATLASLKQADLLDGTEDQVIGKCYSCALGMDGSEAYAVEVHGYQAFQCSAGCQDHFQQSAEEVIAKTEIPATK